MLCISHHHGVQLIFAYSWARPAILVAGKGGGGMFLAHLYERTGRAIALPLVSASV